MAGCLEICDSTKAQLSELSCPFTWELSEAAVKYHASKKVVRSCINEELHYDIPIIQIMVYVTHCYECVMSAANESARESLERAETILQDSENRKELSKVLTVVEHVLNATKCHFLYEIEDEENLGIILRDINKLQDFNQREIGILDGCRSIAFSIYHEYAMEEAISAVRKAIERDPDNPIWCFILAKNLRRKRRLFSFYKAPCHLEKSYFERAYKMSNQPIFTVYYAQFLKESSFSKKGWQQEDNTETWKKIYQTYEEMLDKGLENRKVLLKMALSFLRSRDIDRTPQAERCLDIVDKISPNHATCLHYRGILHQKRGDYKEAIDFFKKAADLDNIAAEFQYVSYGWEVAEVEPVEYLQGMLKRHTNIDKYWQQQINLQLATSYYVIDKDIKNAARYFLMAIKIDPNSNKLSDFYKFLDFSTRGHKFGIYSFLSEKFLPQLRVECGTDATIIDLYTELKSLCETKLQDCYANARYNNTRYPVPFNSRPSLRFKHY